MMKYTLILTALLFILTACGVSKKSKATEQTLWVNSVRVSCEGLVKMRCLQVQEGEELSNDNWEFLYQGIEGFTFQAGYIHKLKIKKEELDPQTVPADGSSIRYTLIEVLEKRADKKVRLHDIWGLKRINGKAIPRGKESGLSSFPQLEIYLAEMRFLGNDGCNEIRGELAKVNETELSFGNIAGTKKRCREMAIPNAFRAALPSIKKYQIKNLELILLNELGEEVLVFQKMD